MSSKVELTMLNSMAGSEIESALDQHIAWGLRVLDLKEAIYGKRIDDLFPHEVRHVVGAIAVRRLTVETLSTGIFYADIEQGEAAFRAQFLSTGIFYADIEQGEAAFRAQFADRLARILRTARMLKPRNVRLLSAKSSKRATFTNCADYLRDQHPWVFSVYREAVEKLHQAGFMAVIENEVNGAIFANPQEIVDFFAALDCGDKVGLIWDIANLWQEGTFPSLAVYEQLKPLIKLVHVKGGRKNDDPASHDHLASSLADAAWPVQEILSAVIRDGVSPVICLNPSHGAGNPGYAHTRDDYHRDILYLRQQFEGIV
jgi:sugar phosphate isomerase/epimerase